MTAVTHPVDRASLDYTALSRDIKRWGGELGFHHVGITDTQLGDHPSHLRRWLDARRHGEMGYMARNVDKRTHPERLVPGTVRVITLRMDYLPEPQSRAEEVLAQPTLGFVSRYALGRDYHKLIRRRVRDLARRIEETVGAFGFRAFVDSAPVLEKALAQRAGLGWIGKHTNVLQKHTGSWFFLGELYTDLPLPVDQPAANHCGSCRACIDVCPTRAIVAPYELDARRCISYLTIELRGPIPVALRPLVGNRIYGCDDCQLACPWNKYAELTTETDFLPRHGLDAPRLVDLFAWSEEDFLQRTAGSAVRRIGHECWLRNIAVALGNAPTSNAVTRALESRLRHPSPLVREHVQWALARHRQDSADTE